LLCNFLVRHALCLGTPTLFGFANDFQVFSPQRLFTAINSNVTDVSFFVPGTSNAATTSAFGLIFVDVEVANLTTLQFFDEDNNLIFTRSALAAGNQGLSFLGGVANAGEEISRVRITSGLNTIVSNGVLGNPNDDVVVMDDFIYAEPTRDAVPVAEPSTLPLMASAICLLATVAMRRAGRRTNAGESGTDAG